METTRNNKTKRILTICEHGNIRSVAMAYLLKVIYGHNALPMGLRETDEETRKMLYLWSERIFVMDKALYEEVCIEADKYIRQKPELCNVGKDIWHNSNAQELHHKILKQLKNFDL